MWYSKKIFANTGVSKQELNIPVSISLRNILKDLQSKNWRGLIVGGAVRDAVTGQIPKDVDVEVYGPTFDQLAEVLKKHGNILGSSSQTDESQVIGKAFGVIKFKDSEGNDYDFSLPRRDSKTGVGHTGFDIQVDPNMSPKEAASRRDFTINSLAYDPLTQELHDYFGGKDDLQNKILRATDAEKFGEDPLRVLRGMQFSARMGLAVEPDTAKICRNLADEIKELYKSDSNPGGISKERITEEFMKLTTKGKFPGSMIQYLQDTGWIKYFPQINAIVAIPQEFEWHPEGWSTSVVSSESLNIDASQLQPINLLTRELIEKVLSGTTDKKANSIVKRVQASSHVFENKKIAQNNNVVRVVFKVPLNSMLSILKPDTDNTKIVSGVIESVAGYMMDTMHESPNVQSTNISSKITNPQFAIVDNNVVFDFGLQVDGNINNVPNSNGAYLVNIGDVSTHTAHVMNAAAEIADRRGLAGDDRAVAIFAALGHDFAKAFTTEQREKGGRLRWTAHGHEEAGGPVVQEFLESLGVKKDIISRVVPLVKNHLNHINYKNEEVPIKSVRNLAHDLYPSTIEDLIDLIEADHSGRPPLPKGLPDGAKWLFDAAKSDNVHNQKPPQILTGKHVMPWFNGKGGPHVGKVVNEAYDAYLKGKYTTPEEAQEWLKNHMRSQSQILRGQHVLPYFGGKGNPSVGKILDHAWDAQLSNQYKDEASAQEWLDNYMKTFNPES